MSNLDDRINARADEYYINKEAYRRARRRYKHEQQFWTIFPTILICGLIFGYTFKNILWTYMGLIFGLGPIILSLLIKKIKRI